MSALDLALLVLLFAVALWTVLTRELMRSVLGLALTSLMLTLLLFGMEAPLAGVFELSVCAGLITVIFVSTISLTRRVTAAQTHEADPARWRRYIALPLILVIVGAFVGSYSLVVHPPSAPPTATVADVLWFARRFDLIGQLLVILAGVFGVVVLFKTKSAASGDTKP
jgi:NADH-quinone oxidoreductase subunit J